jgi:hypothetical protein
MAALIPFTSNYTDVSTYEGYQFEFHCQRAATATGRRSGTRSPVSAGGSRRSAAGSWAGRSGRGAGGRAARAVGPQQAPAAAPTTSGSSRRRRTWRALRPVPGCADGCAGTSAGAGPGGLVCMPGACPPPPPTRRRGSGTVGGFGRRGVWPRSAREYRPGRRGVSLPPTPAAPSSPGRVRCTNLRLRTTAGTVLRPVAAGPPRPPPRLHRSWRRPPAQGTPLLPPCCTVTPRATT